MSLGWSKCGRKGLGFAQEGQLALELTKGTKREAGNYQEPAHHPVTLSVAQNS